MSQLRPADLFLFSFQALVRQRFRSSMALLSVCIGVSAVLMLTALGEGARRYVMHEFSLLGSDVLVMFPGKSETTGGMPPVMGTSQRDITLDDAAQLQPRIVAIKDISPMVIGSADVGFGVRARTVTVLGTNHAFLSMRRLSLVSGKNLSDTDFRAASNECIIGKKLKAALFDNQPDNPNAIGSWVRIGSYRFRVVGILDGDTDSFGLDFGDLAIIPVASAQQLFNVKGLFRVLMEVKPEYTMSNTIQRVEAVMRQLHNADDVTVNSPDAMLESFNKVLGVIAMGIAALGLISLAVAGILIMNITLINVSQRTQEIGLMKALGASSQQVQAIFLMESVLLIGLGTILGIAVGETIVWIGRVLMPLVPFSTPLWAVVFTCVVSLLSGILFAWRPARQSSALSPVVALQGNK